MSSKQECRLFLFPCAYLKVGNHTEYYLGDGLPHSRHYYITIQDFLNQVRLHKVCTIFHQFLHSQYNLGIRILVHPMVVHYYRKIIFIESLKNFANW